MPSSAAGVDALEMSDYTDQFLVERAQRGDRTAFGELAEKYHKRIYELAYGFTHHREDAQDLVQEIFLRAYRGLRRFRRESSFYTWLYCIGQHACTDYLRKRSRQRRIFQLTNTFSDNSPLVAQKRYERPDACLERAELAREIYQAVEQLPIQQQRVFILRHYEGLPLQEIADAMGIRIGSVKAHLFNANHKMRKLLAPYVGEELISTSSS